MSFFGKILDKLGIRQSKASTTAPKETASRGAAPKAAPAPTRTSAAPGQGQTGQAAPANRPAAPQAPPPPRPVEIVDVVRQLEERAAANPQKLNWKTSIVDLLKLLDMDSSLDARRELATELGCPPELMNDSAKMNVWLHKTVLRRIAENGGNVPKDLLD